MFPALKRLPKLVATQLLLRSWLLETALEHHQRTPLPDGRPVIFVGSKKPRNARFQVNTSPGGTKTIKNLLIFNMFN